MKGLSSPYYKIIGYRAIVEGAKRAKIKGLKTLLTIESTLLISQTEVSILKGLASSWFVWKCGAIGW